MTIAVERYGGGRNKSVVDLAENCRVLFLDIDGPKGGVIKMKTQTQRATQNLSFEILGETLSFLRSSSPEALKSFHTR